ncbi:MAG: isocitrate lyase/phosphoenolpyruvate mutase family protein [Acidobacteriota bacterium]|nr:isocitrate lyase/phosphoenolpyruvate mutase family protein [Acidobacteriota bacterium]
MKTDGSNHEAPDGRPLADAAARLRFFLTHEALGVLGGAHDALSARLVQEAGFDGVWASSFGISLASRCVPDADLLSLTECLEVTRRMVDAVSVPVLADCNAGFGNAINVMYMTREYEKAGVGGICIEDNCYPKRCSLYDRGRRELVPAAEMASKIEAAKSAQRGSGFVVIARVEALIAGHGLEAALERAEAYAQAGADALVVHSRAFAQIQEFLARWRGDCPLVVIPTLFDDVPLERLRSAGFHLAIFANQAVRAAVQAMQQTLATIRRSGVGSSVAASIAPLAEVYRLVDLPGLEAAEGRFLLPAGAAPGEAAAPAHVDVKDRA